jgi:hypothetical protein
MINIGLMNEIALMCDRMGIDVWEVIGTPATKRLLERSGLIVDSRNALKGRKSAKVVRL